MGTRIDGNASPTASTMMRSARLRSFHDPALGLEAERLRLGPLIRDEPRGAHHGKGHHGLQTATVGDQEPGHAADEDRVGHPIGGGVEERTASGGRAGRLGHRPVQEVGNRGHHEESQPQWETTGADRDRSRRSRCDPDHGQLVGRDADPMEALADRIDRSFHPLSPVAIEHVHSLRSGEWLSGCRGSEVRTDRRCNWANRRRPALRPRSETGKCMPVVGVWPDRKTGPKPPRRGPGTATTGPGERGSVDAVRSLRSG